MKAEEALRYLYNIVQPEVKKPKAFNHGHILLSLIFLGEAERLSRAQMKSKLGLGTGSIRSLMSHLAMNHVASATPSGFQISQLGKEIRDSILLIAKGPFAVDVEYLRLDKSQVLYFISGINTESINPIRFRDLVVRYGGTGATVCSIVQHKVMILMLEEELAKYSIKDEQEIMKYEPEDGTLACVVSAPSEPVAASSGAAAIVDILLR